MAYISTEQVKACRDAIKKAFPSFKWSISRSHYSTINVCLMESNIDMNEDINGKKYNMEYGYTSVDSLVRHVYKKESSPLFETFKKVDEIIQGICSPCINRNAGDPTADYADYPYFIYLYVGKFDKPYIYKK